MTGGWPTTIPMSGWVVLGSMFALAARFVYLRIQRRWHTRVGGPWQSDVEARFENTVEQGVACFFLTMCLLTFVCVTRDAVSSGSSGGVGAMTEGCVLMAAVSTACAVTPPLRCAVPAFLVMMPFSLLQCAVGLAI